MKSRITLDDTRIALIPEGPTEATLLNMLLDANCFIFTRKDLITDGVLHHKYKTSHIFQDEFLKFTHERKLNIMLVQDKRTPFKLKNLYDEAVSNILYIITRPEIEMLYILHLDLYEDYKKACNRRSGGIKPSVYLAETLQISTKELKSHKYITKSITPEDLVIAIRTYGRITTKSIGENTLCDLLT